MTDLYIQLTRNLTALPVLDQVLKDYADHIPSELKNSVESFIRQYARMLDETSLAIEALALYGTNTLRVDPESLSLVIADSNSLVDFEGRRQYVPYELRSPAGNKFINELMRAFDLNAETLQDALVIIHRKCKTQ